MRNEGTDVLDDCFESVDLLGILSMFSVATKTGRIPIDCATLR
jgi:hypothetical protein